MAQTEARLHRKTGQQSQLAFLTTGGSIDKSYSPHTSSFEIEDSIIEDILADGRVTLKTRVHEVFKKDSLEMGEEDRQHIRRAVEKSPEDRIIITHGTDTIVETGLALRDLGESKVIVLTGAFTPIRFQRTDAVLNLGMAIAAVQVLTPGVYIAINGTIFSVDSAKKDVKDQVFRPVQLASRSQINKHARAAAV